MSATAAALALDRPVHLWGVGLNRKEPAAPPYLPWQEEWERACHIGKCSRSLSVFFHLARKRACTDTQLTLSDLDATPRRMTLGICLW